MTRHKDIILDHYLPRLNNYSEHYEILDWEDKTAQELRFNIFLDHVDISKKKLLDVGCGLGDLYGYILSREIECDYTGIDLIGGMVEKACESFPQGHFIHGDMFKQHIFPSNSFDVVFTSGIFNLNIGNNEEFILQAIKILADTARETIVFNMLHYRSEDKEQQYYYHNPQDIAVLLQEYSCTPQIIEDYQKNDFTVICHLR